MTVALTLGDVIFTEFEIPEKIPFGGDQVLVKHKLPGGNRKLDAMGRDNVDISWTGMFRGGDAELRARRLDYLRVQGQPLTLTWSTFRFQVVIERFRPEFHRQYEIPYSIELCISADEYDATNVPGYGIDELIGGDLLDAIGLGDTIAISDVVSAVAKVQATIQAVQSLRNTDQPTLVAIQSALTDAQSITHGFITPANAAVAADGTVGGMSVLNSPLQNAAKLLDQTSNFAKLGDLYQIQSSLSRMATNLGLSQ